MLRKIIFYSHISVYVFTFSKHQPIHPEQFRVFTYCLNNNKKWSRVLVGYKRKDFRVQELYESRSRWRSVIVLVVSVDVKQHFKKGWARYSSNCPVLFLRCNCPVLFLRCINLPRVCTCPVSPMRSCFLEL